MSARRPPAPLVASILIGAVAAGVRATVTDVGVVGVVLGAVVFFVFALFVLRGARWAWMLQFWSCALAAAVWLVAVVLAPEAGGAVLAASCAAQATLMLLPSSRAYVQPDGPPHPAPAA